jgi:hypothetical protein
MKEILIYILLQFVLFIPFYLIWRNDCKKIGKDNLAVSLGERFFHWILLCPIWIFGFLN